MANGILNLDPDEVKQDILDFYGGDAQQIAQPDAGYFSEFSLPSTRAPVDASNPQRPDMPVMSQNPSAGSTPITFLGGQPAFFERTGIPADIQQALDIFARQSVSTRLRNNARDDIEEYNASLPQAQPETGIPIPIMQASQMMGGQPSQEEMAAQEMAAVMQARQFAGGQPSQREMAAISTPIDRTLQNRISELQTLKQGRVPNIGFMGMRF